MKFIAIDTETTGTAEFCQLLQLGAVFVDTTKPESQWEAFERLISHDRLVGQPYGLAMNQKLLYRIAKGEGFDVNSAMDEFARWFLQTSAEFGVREPVVMAAKNPAFDRGFLNKHPTFASLRISHRMIDVGNLYWEPESDRDSLPDSSLVMARAGQVGEVAHTALEDAMSVARAVTRYVLDRQRKDRLADMLDDLGPQRGPATVPQINAQVKATKARLAEAEQEREVFIEEAQSNWPGSF